MVQTKVAPSRLGVFLTDPSDESESFPSLPREGTPNFLLPLARHSQKTTHRQPEPSTSYPFRLGHPLSERTRHPSHTISTNNPSVCSSMDSGEMTLANIRNGERRGAKGEGEGQVSKPS